MIKLEIALADFFFFLTIVSKIVNVVIFLESAYFSLLLLNMEIHLETLQ